MSNIDTAKEREKLANLDSADLYDMGIILLDALDVERAENERLREALKRIESYRRDAHVHDDDMGHLRRCFDIESVIRMETIARAALNPEGAQ